jgi:hypothetical protein
MQRLYALNSPLKFPHQMPNIKQNIIESLRENNTDINRKTWANHIIENKINLSDLIELIHIEYPVAIRFSWMLGYLCEIKPEVVYPTISYFFNNRNEIKIPNFHRSLAKMFYLCGVPDELEGEVVTALFNWLQDPKSNITTKQYSILALNKITQKHPDLRNEFKIILEEMQHTSSNSLAKLISKLNAEF